MHVIQPRAIVDAVGRDRVPAPDELVEERVALLAAARDTGERAVLPLDAQPGVPHDEEEEPGLPLREAVIGNRLDAFAGRHSNSSSARPPWWPPPPRPPPPPPIRALLPR